MGDISKNLSRHEVACKCGCGRDTIDIETVKIFQECCDHFEGSKVPEMAGKVTACIHSGFRCVDRNKQVCGGANSQHLTGRAIDFTIEGVNPSLVYWYLHDKYPNKYGLGLYVTFTHLDTRSKKARW